MAKKWKYIIPGLIAGTLAVGGIAAYLYLKVIPAQQGTSTLAIAKIVPDDAWMTASINLDFEAWQKLEQFGTPEAQKLYGEGLDTIIKELDQALAEDNLSYSKDYKPWLGNAMMAFLPVEKPGDTPKVLLVLGIKDKLAASDFYNKMKKEDSFNIQETKQYKGVEIVKLVTERSDRPSYPAYIAVLENHLAASDQVTMVKKAIDASQGAPSLATTGESAQAFQSLKLENSVAQFHLFGFFEVIEQLSILNEEDISEIPPELEDQLKQVKSISMGMGIDDQGIRVRSVTQFDPKLWKGQFDPIPGKIISRFPANTLLSANGGNIKKQWPLFVEQFSGIPEFASAIDAMRIYVRQTTRLDVERDIISWMDGEIGFALIPSEEGILQPAGFGGALVFDTSDRKKATATFAKLDAFAKQQDEIKISNSKIGDVEVTHWQSSVSGKNIIGRGWLDDNTVFVTVGQSITQVMANRPQKPLDKNDNFQSVTQSLPRDSGYFYVNMEEVNRLLFSYPGVADSEFDTPEVKAVLNSIRGIGMANAQTDSSTLTSEFLLALKPKQ